MQPKKIALYRDKNDIRDLPPIPERFKVEINELATVLNSNTSDLKKLDRVYATIDSYNTFVDTFSVCEKGCSHCCRIGVSMSQLEAQYIANKGGPAFDTGEQHSFIASGPCPFLSKEGTCSTYHSRPFNCRTFHTLDNPKYCESLDTNHQVYGSAGFGYGVTLYSETARWLKFVTGAAGMRYRDIRDWFPGRHIVS